MPGTKPEKMFDVRTVNWYVSKEQLSRAEYEKFLKSLPDAVEKAEPIAAELHKVEFFRNLVAQGKARRKEEPEDDL